MKPADFPATAAASKRLPFVRTLRARFLLLALIGLALLALLAIYEALHQRGSAEAQARAQASSLAREAAARLDDHLEKVDVVLALASVVLEHHLGEPAQLDGHLETLRGTLPSSVYGLSLFSPAGRMIGSDSVPREAQPRIDISDRPFFRSVRDNRLFAVSEPFESPISGMPELVAVRPIVDANGQVRAVIAASTLVDSIERIAARAATPRDTRFSVYKLDGTLIAGDTGALAVATDADISASGTVTHEQHNGEVPLLAAYASATRADWLVRAAIPRAAVLADADAKFRSDLLIVLLGCSAMGLFTLWLGSRISAPIERLRAGTARLAAGELHHRVADDGDTEIAQLARDFNAMAEELERQRQALQESEQRWQFALDGAGHSVWDWNFMTGRAFYSPRAWQMLGMDAMPFSDYADWERHMHPDDVLAVRAAMRTVLKQPGASAVVEYRMRHADGKWRWFEGRGMSVDRDVEGRAVRVIGTNTDVTDRKLAEARLARLSRMLAALNAMNEAIARVQSPEDLYRRFCEIAVSHSDLRLAIVRLVDEARGCLSIVAESGPHAPHHDNVEIPADPAAVERRHVALVALCEGRVVVANDVREFSAGTEWGAASVAHGILATVSCPVRRAGRIVGLLSLYASEAGYFDDESVALIERMAESLSFALDNFDRESERRAAEERLRASEERFRALTELSSDWYWEQDEHFTFTFMSGHLRDKTHDEISEFLGKTRWDVAAINLTDEDWARHRAQLERQEPFHDFEIQRFARDGRPWWVSISGRPIFGAAGGFRGYRGIGRDITERKLAECSMVQLLAEKQALADRLRAQFRSMPIGCLLFDARHIVTYANPAAARILGVAETELVGIDIAEHFIDPGLRSAIAVRRQRIEAGEELGPIIVALRRPDGEERRCEVHSTALRSDGTLVGVIRMLVDVTDRERAQSALRESEQRYRSLIEVAPDGIVLVRDGVIGYVNDAMARIMHTANPDELLGRPFVEIFVEQDRAAIAEQLTRLDHEVGPGARADRQLIAVDGQIVDVDIRGASYRWNDAIYMQATIRDNSVRKAIHRRVLEINAELERRVNERTAELQAANHELEAFSYSVAHDLRAPLRAIDGFTRILAEDLGDRIDASSRRSFDRVRANVTRMAQLIDDLLAFARVGRRELELVDVDMGALCRTVCDELKPVYPGATLRVSELPVVQGDTTLLRQVFANLIGNALKFSARAEQPVVEVGCTRANGDYIFYVRDNGVGFSMDYVHKLFGVFQRLHGPQEFEGTGVGLAIVQRSLQRHGGRAWAEGEPGKGATFYFALPA